MQGALVLTDERERAYLLEESWLFLAAEFQFCQAFSPYRNILAEKYPCVE
jgi:hypothetical protein